MRVWWFKVYCKYMKISDLDRVQRLDWTELYRVGTGFSGGEFLAQIAGLLPVTNVKQRQVNKPLFSL